MQKRSRAEGSFVVANRSVVCVVAMLALAGCGSGADAEADGVRGVAIRDLSGAATMAELDRLDKVRYDTQESVIAECMKAAGFTYTPISFNDAHDGGSLSLIDSDDAARYGFGVTTQTVPPVAEVDDPNEQRLQAMSDSESAAWENSYEGCAAGSLDEANVRLGIADLMQVMDDTARLLETDDRMKQARIDWSDCAAEHGVQAQSIEELMDQVAEEARSTPAQELAAVQERERTLATDLLPCTRALYQTNSEVFNELAMAFVDERGIDLGAHSSPSTG